jgi:hypothetical protein
MQHVIIEAEEPMHDQGGEEPKPKASKAGLLLGCLLLAAGIVVCLLILPNFIKIKDGNTAEPRSKQNLHSLQLALERYAVDNAGYYPLDFIELAKQGYMPQNPENAYTARRSRECIPMQLIPPGIPGSPGDFTYVTKVQDVGGVQRVVAYDLYLYGMEKEARKRPVEVTTQGIDASRVIYKLSGARASAH